MHSPSVSSVTNTNSLQPKIQEESTFWDKALEHMEEWDKSANDRERKCKEAELEISRALDKLTKDTNKTKKEPSLLKNGSVINTKKLAKNLDAQTQSFDTKISKLAESMNKKMSTQHESTHQLLRDM
eukprot:2523687-Ditylum_brightwellii.AAC.1